jgi:molybdopterin molybdotransferase
MRTVNEAELLIKEYLLLKRDEKYVSIETPYPEILAEDLVSDRHYPPFNRVMMDGIAVNFDTFQQGHRVFHIEDVAAAGYPRKKLQDNTRAIEVMTGCSLPDGCDLVIPYEHLNIEKNTAKIIQESQRKIFDNIHQEGSDIDFHQTVLKKGIIFDGPSAGIASSMGYKKIKVELKPKILIVSTGDELVEINNKPEYYQLRTSNSYALKKSLQLNGYYECDIIHLKDDVMILTEHFKNAAHNYQIIIYTGGVSKGKFDFLPKVWERNDVEKIFHGVAQRPGKPMWFGIHRKTKSLIFGLPGNPVSCLICLHRYILNLNSVQVELQEEIQFEPNLTLFKPVKIVFDKNAKILAFPASIKNSGEFTALEGTHGFIELPQDKIKFLKGEIFPFFPWRPLL